MVLQDKNANCECTYVKCTTVTALKVLLNNLELWVLSLCVHFACTSWRCLGQFPPRGNDLFTMDFPTLCFFPQYVLSILVKQFPSQRTTVAFLQPSQNQNRINCEESTLFFVFLFFFYRSDIQELGN